MEIIAIRLREIPKHLSSDLKESVLWGFFDPVNERSFVSKVFDDGVCIFGSEEKVLWNDKASLKSDECKRKLDLVRRFGIDAPVNFTREDEMLHLPDDAPFFARVSGLVADMQNKCSFRSLSVDAGESPWPQMPEGMDWRDIQVYEKVVDEGKDYLVRKERIGALPGVDGDAICILSEYADMSDAEFGDGGFWRELWCLRFDDSSRQWLFVRRELSVKQDTLGVAGGGLVPLVSLVSYRVNDTGGAVDRDPREGKFPCAYTVLDEALPDFGSVPVNEKIRFSLKCITEYGLFKDTPPTPRQRAFLEKAFMKDKMSMSRDMVSFAKESL